MSLDVTQQFKNVIAEAKNVLIFTPENAGGDALGAAWAVYFFLAQKDIQATVVVAPDNHQLERFAFLQKPESIIEGLAGARDFVLAFNMKNNKITNVKTERVEDELRIFITPAKGSIDPRDFSFIPAKFKYDLVIAVGCQDKESIGKVYEENPDIFYEVPVVNIDQHTGNDQFGQINLVDIQASSTCEILAETFLKISEKVIDEKIAQCLLAGIIEETNSFQKKNTTPKALQISAILMSKGANQQEIIRFLYKTQPLHLLKLWGRVMARLQWESELELVWAPVFLDDFLQSRSHAGDVPFILNKIKENYTTGKIFMVLHNEDPDQIKGFLKDSNPEELQKITTLLQGRSTGDTCQFSIQASDTTEAGKLVVEKIRLLFENKEV
ncbi:MAG: DHH family phosphoesterase [Candidatus Moraniibacteriota bacterium]